MLLPTTLPSAISLSPPAAAPMLTASSGALVPNATTVRPMITGESPLRAARRDDPRTSDSAPTTRATTPTTNQTAARGLMGSQHRSARGRSKPRRPDTMSACAATMTVR